MFGDSEANSNDTLPSCGPGNSMSEHRDTGQLRYSNDEVLKIKSGITPRDQTAVVLEITLSYPLSYQVLKFELLSFKIIFQLLIPLSYLSGPTKFIFKGCQ